MKKNNVTFEEFKEKVIPAKLNETFDINPSFPYKFFRIDDDCKGQVEDGKIYSWSADGRYEVVGHSRFVCPTISTNMVKTFKTINGAKRNLIKHFSYLWEE